MKCYLCKEEKEVRRFGITLNFHKFIYSDTKFDSVSKLTRYNSNEETVMCEECENVIMEKFSDAFDIFKNLRRIYF